MSEQPRRLYDRISDPAYLEDLASLSTDKLRDRREECEELEAEISYIRRLLQGKLDIVRDELERRAAGGDSDIQSLIERLPSILGGSNAGSGGRHLRILVPRNADRLRRDVERIASETILGNIDKLALDDLSGIMSSLSEAEATASEQRRRVQQVADGIRAELVRRYREGLEDPTHLLSR